MDTIRRRAAETAHAIWSATALLLSLAFVAGILAASEWPLSGGILVASALVGLLMAALGRHRRGVWLPGLLLVALAMGMWRYDSARPPAGAAGLPFYLNRDVTLVGTIAAEPEPLDRGENVRVAVETLAAAGAPRRVQGMVLVHLGGLTDLSYGDRVSVAGALAPPPELPGSSAGSYRAYLASQGIYAVMNYPRLGHLGTGGGNPLLALAIAIRRWLEEGIRRILPGPQAALLLGILLGARTRSLGTLTGLFVTTGMIHIVAISGLKPSRMSDSSLRAGVVPHAPWCSPSYTVRRMSGKRSSVLRRQGAIGEDHNGEEDDRRMHWRSVALWIDWG